LARRGHSLADSVDKELASTLTTIHRKTGFLDSPMVQAVTTATDFNPYLLKAGRMTVYIVVPAHMHGVYGPLVRSWLWFFFHVACNEVLL
jgi:type IV secretory pathway TraG/TraD family ATPase VirD4